MEREINHYDRKYNGSGNLGFLGSVAGAYLAATLALNIITTPILAGFNGLERAVGAERKQTTATLLEKGVYEWHGINICWGKFKTDSGEVNTLTDSADILTGKFLPNTKLCKARIGDSYRVNSLEGPISNKVLNLQKIK